MRLLEYTRPPLTDYQKAALFCPERYAVVEATTKAGKAQPLDALVYSPAGPRRMGDLAIGDVVLTPGGGRAQILGVFPQGDRPIFRVTFSDGSITEADAGHLWEVCQFRQRPKVVPLAEMMTWSADRLHRAWVRPSGVAAFEASEVPFDAYALGLLLGDGGLTGDTMRFSSADQEILDALLAALPPGHQLTPCGGVDWRVGAGPDAAQHREAGTHVRSMIRGLGLLGTHSDEKFIPDCYRYNTEQVRRSVLQGLLDTDGFVDKHGQPAIEQTSERLARDISEVVRSLGGSVLTRLRSQNGYRANDGRYIDCKPVWRQVIRFSDARWCFRLARKAERVRVKRKTGNRFFRSIELVGTKPAQCIQVDSPDNLYLTDDFLPTHNTAGCMVWLAEKALLGKDGQSFWWIAPIFPQAKIVYRRLKRALDEQLYTANETELTITLANGAVIWFKGADKPDSLYGEDVYAAVIDEASRCKEEAWHAVRSTLTKTRGQIRIIGNVKGRRNWAYMMARRAEQGEPDMRYAKITAYDAVKAGILTSEEIEDAKRVLPEQVFRELYEAEPTDDGGNPFGLSAIRSCIGPLSTAEPVAWGVDLAKSEDYTVAIGLDESGAVCRFERWQGPWAETLERVSRLIGQTPTACDSTGVGDPIVEALQRRAFHLVESFKFTSQSKQQIIEGVAVAIQTQAIRYPDGPIVQELESFEYEYSKTGVRYSAAPGLHDDCVCALALAVYKLRQPAGLLIGWA